ncbi:MAG: hypothetical protein ACLPSW_02785 [Roseiarcus sp.]
MLALSSRTRTDGKGQQRAGFCPFTKPLGGDRYLRIADVHRGIFAWQESPTAVDPARRLNDCFGTAAAIG